MRSAFSRWAGQPHAVAQNSLFRLELSLIGRQAFTFYFADVVGKQDFALYQLSDTLWENVERCEKMFKSCIEKS